MITRRTKIQLVIFVIITLLGVSFVGASTPSSTRYVVDDTYEVTAHFNDSGGVFAGSQVTYRGVAVGRVDRLVLTDDGVDVVLQIEKGDDEIPADTSALVGNGSAVGEQYVELQPQSNEEPYLEDGLRDRGRRHRDPDLHRDAAVQPLDHGRARSTRTSLKTTVDEFSDGVRAAPARTCSGSSTPATRSSRPPTTTST